MLLRYGLKQGRGRRRRGPGRGRAPRRRNRTPDIARPGEPTVGPRGSGSGSRGLVLGGEWGGCLRTERTGTTETEGEDGEGEAGCGPSSRAPSAQAARRDLVAGRFEPFRARSLVRWRSPRMTGRGSASSLSGPLRRLRSSPSSPSSNSHPTPPQHQPRTAPRPPCANGGAPRDGRCRCGGCRRRGARPRPVHAVGGLGLLEPVAESIAAEAMAPSGWRSPSPRMSGAEPCTRSKQPGRVADRRRRQQAE